MDQAVIKQGKQSNDVSRKKACSSFSLSGPKFPATTNQSTERKDRLDAKMENYKILSFNSKFFCKIEYR